MSFWRTMAVALPFNFLILSLADNETFTADWWIIFVPLLILNYAVYGIREPTESKGEAA